MILGLTLKLTRKSHLQDRSDLFRMISYDNAWLPFDPFVLFFFLCAMPWLWRPHQSMPCISGVSYCPLSSSVSCKVAMTTSHPNISFKSSHPTIPATPIFHALVTATDAQFSSLFPALRLHASRRKPDLLNRMKLMMWRTQEYQFPPTSPILQSFCHLRLWENDTSLPDFLMIVYKPNYNHHFQKRVLQSFCQWWL